MAKSTAPSPKANLLRGTYAKVYTAFKRSVGEIGRVRGTPKSAAREVEKAQAVIASLLAGQLGRGGLPVVSTEAPAPKGEHWLVSGISVRNALYARDPLTVAVAYVAADGTCPIGAVYLPQEDLCIVAEAGLGVSGEGVGRLRVGGRVELDDTLAMLPWKTTDVVKMKLMDTLNKAGVHTRKSGDTLSDVVDVALGRADVAIATRATRIEALLANLILAESGGFASDIKGKPLGPDSDTLVVSNTKLHAQLVALLK
jgi:DNA uptake protein ComE-like DNA-binding protein